MGFFVEFLPGEQSRQLIHCDSIYTIQLPYTLSIISLHVQCISFTETAESSREISIEKP